MKYPEFKTHERLYEALIFSANEEENKPIEGAYKILKEVWFFVNSDEATYKGKPIDKIKRPLIVNGDLTGTKADFDNYFEALANDYISYSCTMNKIKITEKLFIKDLINWIDKRLQNEDLAIGRRSKYEEFREYLNTVKPDVNATVEEPKKEKEPDLITSLRKHFQFLTERGARNMPMMTNEQFEKFIDLAHCYFSNGFKLPKNPPVIKTMNVTKTKFLWELKVFYFNLPEREKSIPESLVDLANCIKQNKWTEVTMKSLHKASIK